MTAQDLAATFGAVDAIVFNAGSNGGRKEVTRAIDGDGVVTAITAAPGTPQGIWTYCARRSAPSSCPTSMLVPGPDG